MTTYTVSHRTQYAYSEPVQLCHNELRLRPPEFDHQSTIATAIDVKPHPALISERGDVFGNSVTYFSIQEAHRKLDITATCTVEVSGRSYPEPHATPPWEEARYEIGRPRPGSPVENNAYVLDSPYINRSEALADFARPSFSPGRPLLEATLDLMNRIFTGFRYTPGATTLSTPLPKILRQRKGVCQDFAHIAIGALRSLGLPARYVSGYIETTPAEGALVGADASHAWASVYVPQFGWIDFDPTNNHMPLDQHIVLAVGRDYSDVTPIKGVSMGGGKQTLRVAVKVSRQN
ncbi:MAG: transglutaminase family protein [Leptospiraceae bacterium]|nr:transglutaminase family protein [Leptospiraceae bacterium]